MRPRFIDLAFDIYFDESDIEINEAFLPILEGHLDTVKRAFDKYCEL